MYRNLIVSLGIALLLSGCLPTRYAVYNFANITDWKKFPSRPLEPSATPFRFAKPAVERKPRDFSIGGKSYDFDTYLRKHQTVAFLILRNDTLLYERYFRGYDAGSKVASFSMAKSVASALVGAAIADGLIRNVDDPVTAYVPELAPHGFDKVTLRHLLQMTAGLDFDESYVSPFAEAASFYYGRHLRQRTLRLKLKDTPGRRFEYTSGSTQILGLVLERVLKGKTLTAYLQEKLWTPLQMEHPASWSIDQKRDGLEKTFCCLNASAVDFAKIGRLYRDGGTWNGRPVLPSSWVRESTHADTSAGGARFYKYQWWLPSAGGDFCAQGHLGQFVYVEPKKNLIIVRLGRAEGGVPWVTLFRLMAANL